MKVLITGGYGYQNVGDEALLDHLLELWKNCSPEAELLVFTPDPEYTRQTHKCKVALAPRVVLFHSDKTRHYGSSNIWFKLTYPVTAARMMFFAKRYKEGLSLPGIEEQELGLLKAIKNSDVLHIAGGGILTGMTLSRLWENMLVIEIAYELGTPVILSGHTVGIFKDIVSRKLAKNGLSKAELIYLRDPDDSMRDIESLGLSCENIKSTFDDALFCTADEELGRRYLKQSGLPDGEKFLVANACHWGWNRSEFPKVTKRFAESLDYACTIFGCSVVFLPMHSSDIPMITDVRSAMSGRSFLLEYGFDYKAAKGVIKMAEVCFTFRHHPIIFAMGAGTPVLAVALDDYYKRKNFGALKLFNQQEYLMDRSSFFSKTAFDTIQMCMMNRLEIRRKIMNKLNELKPLDGEIIMRFLDGWHKK